MAAHNWISSPMKRRNTGAGYQIHRMSSTWCLQTSRRTEKVDVVTVVGWFVSTYWMYAATWLWKYASRLRISTQCYAHVSQLQMLRNRCFKGMAWQCCQCTITMIPQYGQPRKPQWLIHISYMQWQCSVFIGNSSHGCRLQIVVSTADCDTAQGTKVMNADLGQLSTL